MIFGGPSMAEHSVNLCSDFWALGRGMVLAPAGHSSSLGSVSPWQSVQDGSSSGQAGTSSAWAPK